MAPMSWNGSQIIYNKVVRPLFLRHEATVDNMVSDLSGKAMNVAENLTREVLSTLVKNKTLVTPMPPVAQAKSLPSSSGQTSNARVAPCEPSAEERRVSRTRFLMFFLSSTQLVWSSQNWEKEFTAALNDRCSFASMEYTQKNCFGTGLLGF
ncbi:hypothetical protein GOODEAATRI_017557 [Goodea atripinnis]|uniref:Uncharacterized protein n=1 Tax=Goodea atripinnis TaxID=208336 RepID=A0ABV0PYU1_9TELE